MEETQEIIDRKEALVAADHAIRDAYEHRVKIAEPILKMLQDNYSDTFLGVCYRMKFTPSYMKDEEA